ncbi:MAG: GntR family transcriptional regulator [Gammaproteobacteria bacterium]
MIFKISPASGQPIYLQIMQQIRDAIEAGVLRYGDLLPGIRKLAEQLGVSHTTVAKAYSELEHAGVLELRPGSGAFVAGGRSTKSRSEKIKSAKQRIKNVVKSLQHDGFSEEEIRRLFEAELLLPPAHRELV